jgi:hypothetical protein
MFSEGETKVQRSNPKSPYLSTIATSALRVMVEGTQRRWANERGVPTNAEIEGLGNSLQELRLCNEGG